MRYVENERSFRWSNLDREEKEGLTSIRRKIKAQDRVIFQTDKSERFSVDSKDNYKAACQPHISEDTKISEEEHKELQHLVNAHAVA